MVGRAARAHHRSQNVLRIPLVPERILAVENEKTLTGVSDKQEFEYKLSGGLPDGNIPALINHIRTFLGKEELIEFVRHALMVFCLADCSVNT